MTKIAVILPVYIKDSPLFFDAAVKSILQQTVDVDLYICKDGALTDRLDNLCLEYPKDRVKIIQSQQNKGLPTILNKGIKIALDLGYDYIARMDSDDISDPKRIEKQFTYLCENKDVHILGTNAILINSQGDYIGKKELKTKVFFSDLKYNCELIHPSVMFRRSFFEQFGFYDDSLLKSQDYELWLRSSKDGAIIRNLSQHLIQFRYEPNIISRRKKEQKYNIQIKYKHLTISDFLPSIIRPLAILLCPSPLLRWLLTKHIS
ncbi:MAG: glycosyltransferase [Bacteroidota bacterium]|nr:glycosyltransferase [Bacteroidota bacterium]